VTLQDIGIGESHERVYRALIAHPECQPGDLATLSRVAPPELPDTLRGLTALGLCCVDPSQPAGVRIANPATVFSKLIEQAQEEMLERNRRLTEALADMAAMFAARWETEGQAAFDQAGYAPAEFGTDGSELTDEDRRLLRLLADGHTDESAARRLGASVRRVRRRMAALTSRLDATSRFSAGVAAARRGWL
jgi:DNA-binding NarL/FixJ family response regulator